MSRSRVTVLPKWIEVWLWMSTILCILDVAYTMLRPMTNRGGSLEHVYAPWNLYADVDHRYAEADDLVTMATGRVMIIEIVMNIAALIMARYNSRHTLLTTFTTNAFVFWKTLWFLVLYIAPPEGTRPMLNQEASILKTILVFWVPNSFWVTVPFVVLVALWNKLARPVETLEYSLTSDDEKSIQA